MLILKDLFTKACQRTVSVLVMLFASVSMLWAQDANEKFSLTTQMLLNEMKELSEQPKSGPRRAPSINVPENILKEKSRRMIARPDTVGGVAYVSCFIHLKDASSLSQVRSLGVKVEETFEGMDFVTARVPVNQLEKLAGIDNVTQIKVARQMRVLTDVARQKTNVDDLLTQSADATAAGVNSLFDGSGVVLGIIDTGIDFQHIAFKDKNGKSRIKKAYVYNGSSAQEYSTITSSSPTTDDQYEDHGTHTATTAGGSSVKVSGSTVTVTDDHTTATYGGMAPGADLYLAGINGLEDTYLTNAIKRMVTYADNQGKPLVVSNSWGSGWGPRDGTGELAELVSQYFGDNHPNHIILFASSNDAGHKTGNEGGGFFVKKSSVSSSSPLGTIIRTDGNGGNFYQGLLAIAYASKKLNCKLYVLDNSTGTIKKTVSISSSQSSISGLSSYYNGSVSVYLNQDNGKYNVIVYSENGLESYGDYTLAIEVMPSSGSTDVNMWAGDWSYFTNHLTTSSHTWLEGTDDMCVSDEATIPDVITVGAYVTKKRWKASDNSYYTASEYTVGDIAYFSSYATADQSPTGVAYPWISAPGARIAAGVNHYHTSSADYANSYYGKYSTDLVVNSSSSPYAVMEGTSMATPVAAGIVALWMQAAKSVNMDLTVNDVKTIMEQTAISDSYTTGANASHFGKGKIDALAGIRYILSSSNAPTITASRSSIDFSANYEPDFIKTETITVNGFNLEADITITLNDPSGDFSVSTQSIPMATAESGVDVTVTWTPSTIGESVATLTLSSSGADDVVISLTGNFSAVQTYSLVTDASTLKAGEKVLIAYVDGDDVYVLSTNQKSNNRDATTDVVLNADGTITPGDAAQIITLEKNGENFLLNVGNGYLYAASSGSNYLRTETSPDANGNANAAISISEGNATIRFQGTYTRNLLGFNKGSSPKLFSCYSGTSTNVQLPQIYREAPVMLSNSGKSNDDIISAYNGKTVNVALIDRTFYRDGSWNTICVPFDLAIADSPLAGADVRALSSATLDEGILTLNFTEAGGVTDIAAGTPYIIKWPEEDENIVNPIFNEVTINAATNDFTSTDGMVRFMGTYNLITYDGEDKSILFMGKTNTLYYPLSGARIGSFHSYFKLADDSPVKQFVLNLGDEEDPTGLHDLKGSRDHKDSTVIYNLSGQQMANDKWSTGKLPRGIYIRNGKKVVK